MKHREGGMREKNSAHTNNIYFEVSCTLTPVGAAPQVSDNLVDFIHLHAVEFHDGSEESKKHTKLQTLFWYKYYVYLTKSHLLDIVLEEISLYPSVIPF